MYKSVFAALLVCLAAVPAHAQNTGHGEAEFVSGGDIRFDLSAGDYDIVAAHDSFIRVSWRSDHGEDANKVDVGFHIVGRTATISTKGPHNNMHYTIEAPKSSNLTVRLSAGDLHMAGIEGSKDVQIHAGDLRIAVGDPSHYGQVDLSVNAGDINASPFGGNKDGLFRSYHWTGKGSYRLHVHLGAGDINLVSSDSI